MKIRASQINWRTAGDEVGEQAGPVRLEHLISKGWTLSCWDNHGLKLELTGPGLNPIKVAVYPTNILEGLVKLELGLNEKGIL